MSKQKKATTGTEKARLKQYYLDKVVPALTAQFSYQNPMEVPRIEKITLNMGVGEAASNRKIADLAQENLTQIAGQKAVITLARKSEANFKIREGWPVGCKVTLRRARMYEFLDRLLSVALPRERDFRGLNPKAFDRAGNYSMGLSEQIIFPEINYDSVDAIRGLDITITTSARNPQEGYALLKAMRFPFRELKTAEGKKDGQ
jgi:large subunit ribosomal protein L5